jgi:hypothetical protein
MMNAPLGRVLCLDLRARRFGYVVFEGPRTIIDYGIKTYGDERYSSLKHRLDGLQSRFKPSLILIRKSESSLNRRTRAFIKRFAKHSSGVVRLIDKSSVNVFFAGRMRSNKHEIAKFVVERLPELSWQLPAKRKPWQPEPRQQTLFDAASLVLFYFPNPEDAGRFQDRALSPVPQGRS